MAARYRTNASSSTPSTKPAAPPTPSASSAAVHPTPSKPQPEQNISHKNAPDTDLSTLSVLDILRVIGGVLLLSSGMSYLVNSGQSMTWGYNPWWTRAREWKGLLNPQVFLTETELAKYDGSDPTLPIYLALNGTIYDVSAGRATYAPGGSYHFFAGRDAARAFITGCFQEDQTADLRGVEDMYMPIDPPVPEGEQDSFKSPVVGESEDPVVDAHRKARGHDKRRPSSSSSKLGKGELKIRRQQELRRARKKVRDGLEHWHQLFRGDKGKPYFKVGEVKREEGWLEKLPKRQLCESAAKGRPVRKEG